MIQHLTSDQISQCVLGDASPETAAHLNRCTECAARLAQLTDSLGMFRSAIRETAGNLGGQQRTPVITRRRMAVLWLTVAAALITVTALPVYKIQDNRQKAAAIAKQDAELMEQVNAGLSEGVATPLKPLQKMVSWGPGMKITPEKRNF